MLASIKELKDIIEQWLGAIRRREESLPSSELVHKLIQTRLANQQQNSRAEIEFLIDCGCERVAQDDVDSAELLRLYYIEGHSIQAIKNNRKRPESVPTLWRRVKSAVGLLTQCVYELEMEAQQEWGRLLLERLPVRPYDVLFGRNTAIDQLVEWLVEFRAKVINLVGLGGLGKSSLAWATVARLIERRLFADVVWITLDGHDSQNETLPSSNELLDGVSRQLFAELIDENPTGMNRRQRMVRLRRHLSERRHLIVIDNLEAFDDNGTFSEQLHALTEASQVLVISRTRIVAQQPVRVFSLQPIGHVEVIRFVRDRAQKVGIDTFRFANEAVLERLYALVGGHPQALRLFVQLGEYFSAEIILAEFENAQFHDIETLYHSVYLRLWERQTTHAQQLLDALRPVPMNGAEATELVAYSGLSHTEQLNAIRELTDAALIDSLPRADTRRYRMHNLTQAFLASLDHNGVRTAADQSRHDEQLIHACRHHLEQSLGTDVEYIHQQQPFLTRLARQALRRPACWQSAVDLMLSLYFSIENSFYWREWLHLFQLALDEADEEAHQHQYRLYSRLGTLTRMTDRYDEAAAMHRRALELAQMLKDVKAAGREHVHLAATYRYLDKFQLAEQHGHTALDIFEELQLHPHFHLAALNCLGQIAMQQLKFDDAADFFHDAVKRGKGHVPGAVLVAVYTNWGDTLRLMGNRPEALEKYKAAEAYRGSADSLGDLLLDYGVCNLHLDNGEVERAAILIERMRSVSMREGVPVLHRAHATEAVGRYHLQCHEFEIAIRYLEQAAHLWIETDFHQGSIHTLLLLKMAHCHIENEPPQEVERFIHAESENSRRWHHFYDRHYQVVVGD